MRLSQQYMHMLVNQNASDMPENVYISLKFVYSDLLVAP